MNVPEPPPVVQLAFALLDNTAVAAVAVGLGQAAGAVIVNVPGHGLLGVGQVSNQMKYCRPAVRFTFRVLELPEVPTELTQVPPAVGHPWYTRILVHV
jgi:hypothetical protein